MNDITLSIPAELVETLISIVDFILFGAACMIKGAITLWIICFICWVAFLSVTGLVMAIKSILKTN